MAKREDPKFHRLHHREGNLTIPVKLNTLSKGDIFVRQGTPHMLIGEPTHEAGVSPSPFVTASKLWIVNLVSGSCWPVPASEEVYPAFNVELTFDTTRRGD